MGVEDLDLLLRPIRAKHGRNGHAERVALIRVLQLAPFVCTNRSSSSCEFSAFGTVRLFISRWPCTSCLAVFCQWRALFPHVQLFVAFDDKVSTVSLDLD